MLVQRRDLLVYGLYRFAAFLCNARDGFAYERHFLQEFQRFAYHSALLPLECYDCEREADGECSCEHGRQGAVHWY